MTNVSDAVTKFEAPQSAYLFVRSIFGVNAAGLARVARTQGDEILHFQYWPASLQDTYDVEYVEHFIPGGSHPLYQWSGGRARTISFEAVFTAEVDETFGLDNKLGRALPLLTPSALFTVDVAAALAKIRGWMRPTYGDAGREAIPPPTLVLMFKNSALNGSIDTVDVILRNAPITIESWFPSGRIRVATVQMTFSETVQHQSGGVGQSSTVTFIGRENFEDRAAKYMFRGLSDTNIGP